MLCTLIGAIILSTNIQVGLNMHLYDDMGMHRRPFEGRHLVFFPSVPTSAQNGKNELVCFRVRFSSPPSHFCWTNIIAELI